MSEQQAVFDGLSLPTGRCRGDAVVLPYYANVIDGEIGFETAYALQRFLLDQRFIINVSDIDGKWSDKTSTRFQEFVGWAPSGRRGERGLGERHHQGVAAISRASAFPVLRATALNGNISDFLSVCCGRCDHGHSFFPRPAMPAPESPEASPRLAELRVPKRSRSENSL